MDGREALATVRLAALARSIDEAGHGNLPILLEAVGTVRQWAVVSRTGRAVYTLTSQDGCASITCDCPAATDQCFGMSSTSGGRWPEKSPTTKEQDHDSDYPRNGNAARTLNVRR